MTNLSTTSLSLPDMPDILYHIFGYLDPIHHSQYGHDEVYECRRSLARAARTCRGFTGLALDILWKQLPDDQPLADLLCTVGIATREEDRVELESFGENEPERDELSDPGRGGYSHRSVLKEHEGGRRLLKSYDTPYSIRDAGDPRKHPGWPRFVKYASRVRSITLFAFDGPAWGTLWQELRSRTNCAPILPRLLTITFHSITKQDFPPETLELISPSVSRLNFNVEDEFAWPALRERLACLFSQTFVSAPEINHLQLTLLPSGLGAPLLRSCCSRIHRLEVYPLLTLDELRLLTEFPSLRHLSIALSRNGFLKGSPSFTLESITTLDVKGTWINLDILLDTVRLPSLNTLIATGRAYGESAAELAKDATQCFGTIAAKCSSITSLSISASCGLMPPSQENGVYTVPMVEGTFEVSFLDLVHPLLALSALQDLSLSLPDFFEVTCTADDLRAVAQSFRALEVLHLSVSSYPFGAPAARKASSILPYGEPELDAIVHFARNCPRLRILHLPTMEFTGESLALAAVGNADGSGEHPRERHGLRMLVIPRVLLPPGRADLAREVLQLVRRMFPLVVCPLRLEEVVTKEGRAVAVGASWECPKCVFPWGFSSFSW